MPRPLIRGIIRRTLDERPARCDRLCGARSVYTFGGACIPPNQPIAYASTSNITITTTATTPYQRRLSLKSIVHLPRWNVGGAWHAREIEKRASEGFRAWIAPKR